MSIYRYMQENLHDGILPAGFRLPPIDDGSGMPWADGALDGVSVYHVQRQEVDENTCELIARAIQGAATGDIAGADNDFEAAGAQCRALYAADAMQGFIIEHEDKLDIEALYRYALHLIRESDDRESIKFALEIIQMFSGIEEDVKEMVRLLGLSDEFALFAIDNMHKWEDENNEIFDLAKKVYGWGRVYAVNSLMPLTSEISDWILREGINNSIDPGYTAFASFKGSDVEGRLKGNLTQEDFESIGRILDALLDDGPVEGIVAIDNAAQVLRDYLGQAQKHELGPGDYGLAQKILEYAAGEPGDVELMNSSRRLLGSSGMA